MPRTFVSSERLAYLYEVASSGTMPTILSEEIAGMTDELRIRRAIVGDIEHHPIASTSKLAEKLNALSSESRLAFLLRLEECTTFCHYCGNDYPASHDGICYCQRDD